MCREEHLTVHLGVDSDRTPTTPVREVCPPSGFEFEIMAGDLEPMGFHEVGQCIMRLSESSSATQFLSTGMWTTGLSSN